MIFFSFCCLWKIFKTRRNNTTGKNIYELETNPLNCLGKMDVFLFNQNYCLLTHRGWRLMSVFCSPYFWCFFVELCLNLAFLFEFWFKARTFFGVFEMYRISDDFLSQLLVKKINFLNFFLRNIYSVKFLRTQSLLSKFSWFSSGN